MIKWCLKGKNNSTNFQQQKSMEEWKIFAVKNGLNSNPFLDRFNCNFIIVAVRHSTLGNNEQYVVMIYHHSGLLSSTTSVNIHSWICWQPSVKPICGRFFAGQKIRSEDFDLISLCECHLYCVQCNFFLKSFSTFIKLTKPMRPTLKFLLLLLFLCPELVNFKHTHIHTVHSVMCIVNI